MAMGEAQRWRVKIGSSKEITARDLPSGIVSEVTELYAAGTWSVVMTTDRQHIPGLLSRALVLPGFRVFDVWEHSVGAFPPATTTEEADHG